MPALQCGDSKLKEDDTKIANCQLCQAVCVCLCGLFYKQKTIDALFL